MAAKKETLTSLRKHIKDLQESLEKSNKELESQKSSKEYYNKRSEKQRLKWKAYIACLMYYLTQLHVKLCQTLIKYGM